MYRRLAPPPLCENILSYYFDFVDKFFRLKGGIKAKSPLQEGIWLLCI